jgi:hypothetical protein
VPCAASGPPHPGFPPAPIPRRAPTHTVNSHESDLVEAIRELTGGFGTDVVIEAIGRPETYQQAFYARDLAGTVVLVGVPTPELKLELPLLDHAWTKTSGGSNPSPCGGDSAVQAQASPTEGTGFMSNRAALRKTRKRRLTRRRTLAALGTALGMTGAAIAAGVALSTADAATWPTPNGSQGVSSTIPVSGTKDYGMKRLYGTGGLGGGGQDEGQDPILRLADGAVLKNVVIGAPAADGIHCQGSCTLQNVWWEDVGEDAATFRGGNDDTYIVYGGGARKASDKVFQHNGGGKLVVSKFAAQDFGTLYRSCGNCSTQYKRTSIFNTVEVTAPGGRLVGINTNYGDSAALRNITIIGDSSRRIVPCQKYIGNDDGDEPPTNGSGPDGTYCNYTAADLTYR